LTEVRFHPKAQQELDAAFGWYLERSPAAARAFLDEIDNAIVSVSRHPEAWPRHISGTRRRPCRVFPFSVVFSVGQDRIDIVAIAHDKRRPDYWRECVEAT